jgi:hypothetical protein
VVIRFRVETALAALGLWMKGDTVNKAYQKLLDRNQQNKKFGYNSSKLFEVFYICFVFVGYFILINFIC